MRLLPCADGLRSSAARQPAPRQSDRNDRREVWEKDGTDQIGRTSVNLSLQARAVKPAGCCDTGEWRMHGA